MRKLIFFFLLSVATYGQTANGTETKQNAFRSLSPQTVVSPVFVTTMGTDGTMGKASVNNLPLSIPTKDYVDANIPAVYTTIVYVNATSPTTATIFDDENPPTVNDDALKINVANLYIGTDGSTWVYKTSPAGYVTKVVPASSNFNLYNTSIDAGNNKESIVERFGAIASKSGNIVRKNGSDSVLGGGYFSFYNTEITSGNTFQLNASNGLDLWNFASGAWNKRFTFFGNGNLKQHSTLANTEHIISAPNNTPILSFLGADNSRPIFGYKGLGFRIGSVTGEGASGLTEQLQLFASGNLLLQNGGDHIDNGNRLQVTGSISATSYTGSATLTGTPTAPTAPVGTNTTQIANMAALQAVDANVVHKTGDETKSGKLNLSNTNLYSVENPIFSGLTDTGIAGNLNGTYYYSVNYYNSLGETATSGEQTISVVNKQVSVTIPVSPDASVIGRRIYRTIGNPFDAVIKYLVVDIPNNTATSYIDNILDGSLGVPVPRVNTTGGQFFDNTNRIGFSSGGTTSFGLNSALNNTGYANSSFGFGSLTANTVGYRNTSSGVFSLYANTVGYNNNAFGVHALNDNTIGFDNSALGFGASFGNTTGIENVSFGTYAIARNTTGGQNVGIGVNSLKSNVTGSGNLGIGSYAAANALTLGSNNTFIGNSSGYNSTGSGNVFLGNGSGYFETGNNKLFIDNTTRSNESDARIKALVYGFFDALDYTNQFLNINGTLNVNGIGTFNTRLKFNSANQFIGDGGMSTGDTNHFGIRNDLGEIFFAAGGATPQLRLNTDGSVRVVNTPTISAGTYDFLTRNTSTGVVEKIASNTIAPVESPALTGTPTAPTATVGTNTTQIATTAFVQAANGTFVADAITNGVTTVAPSQDAVFDALALKASLSGEQTFSGQVNAATFVTGGSFTTGSTGEGLKAPNNGPISFICNNIATPGWTSNAPITATQYRISALNTAPLSATDTGTLGEIRITATYIYVCTATNTWVRTALATW